MLSQTSSKAETTLTQVLNPDWYYRLGLPLFTTSAGQVIAGAFLGVKADMQNNPKLSISRAFAERYKLNNPNLSVVKGVKSIYTGNFWNYTYTVLCSLTGNNLVQLAKYGTDGLNNVLIQGIVGGAIAGCAESSWTAYLVARELNKTTSSALPNLATIYRRLYPSLALRDSVGWMTIQTSTAFLERTEKKQPLSQIERLGCFVFSGFAAAAMSAPADANLRRLYSEPDKGPITVFAQACKKHGLYASTFAGWQARILTVSPPFMAFAVAQYYMNEGLTRKMAISPA
ncbi:MAG: hypothetical protein K0S29_857 [Gammaproteobacteria bacterium]|jgi:hypothetical protein|nr:hypothetical protein [Gammaproteobacteria bacterium]